MRQLTYGEIKPSLASVAGQTGLSTSDERLLPRVNAALQMMMESADMPLLTDKLRFTITDGHVTLPFDKDRVMEANLDNQPLGYRSPWFEYLDLGNAWARPSGWEDGRNLLLERNESPIRAVLPNEDTSPDYTIVIKGFVDETVGATLSPTVNIRGLDENGAWVRTLDGTDWVDGENVAMDGTSPLFEAATTTKFSEIHSVVKPVTLQHVQILARDGVDPDILLSDYRHQETVPSYRTYYIPSIIDDQEYVLDVRVKSRFVPIMHDSDLMPISNVQALVFAMIAIHKGEVQKTQDFIANFNLSKGMLQDEARTYRGKGKFPTVTFKRSLSIGGFSGY